MDSQSLASNISDTILRTRQIMQESKAITIKNQQRKNMLEEKFSFNDLKLGKDLQSDDIIRRISELELRSNQDSPLKPFEDSQKIETLQSEIFELNKKVKSQALKIESLETKLNEINLEKFSLVQELNSLKNNKKSEEKVIFDLSEKRNVEETIALLEDKYKVQVEENHKLIEEIQKLQGQGGVLNSSKKITELENLLMSSLRKYKGLKERLEKTENLITLEKSSFFSPKSTSSKKLKVGSPKLGVKKSMKNKVSSYKSSTKLN